MKKQFDLSAAALHILAMAFMLLDHLWATLFLSQEWMTCVGRLAFPILPSWRWRATSTRTALKNTRSGC